jgi:hypothetical protein
VRDEVTLHIHNLWDQVEAAVTGRYSVDERSQD